MTYKRKNSIITAIVVGDYMKSYHKNEMRLKEFFHDTYFRSANDELNDHFKLVLAKLDEILISSKASELRYVNIKSNFINQLKEMPI